LLQVMNVAKTNTNSPPSASTPTHHISHNIKSPSPQHEAQAGAKKN
jgi:hypothetical protein